MKNLERKSTADALMNFWYSAGARMDVKIFLWILFFSLFILIKFQHKVTGKL